MRNAVVHLALLVLVSACGLQSVGLAADDEADSATEVGDGDVVRPDDGSDETAAVDDAVVPEDDAVEVSEDATPDAPADEAPDAPGDEAAEVPAGCGNTVVEGPEECDDGNADNTDGCLDTCVAASCGDGFVWAGEEQCDGPAEACTTTCGSTGRHDCVECVWAACVPPAESCNGVDDDCDGETDEGCVAPPPNDTCAGAEALVAGTAHASTADATHDATTSCGGGTGRDVWYTFTLASSSIVYLDTVDGGSWDTVLEVRRGPCPGTVVSGGCNDDSCGGRRSQVALALDAGTYFVVVDGHDATAHGDFGLFFQIASCPVAHASADGDYDGSTTGAGDALGGMCGGGSSEEDALWMGLCRPASVTAHTCSSATNFDTVLYYRTGDCWDGNPEPACNDDSTCAAHFGSSSVTSTLPKGLSFVVVEGYGNAAGNYRLHISGLP